MISQTSRRITINDAAKLIGVSAKTIARWEKSGKTQKAKRDWRGWRVYSEKDIETLKAFNETLFEVL